MDQQARSNASVQARAAQLTIYERPSSWGSSESDSPRSTIPLSPSCYTISPISASAISQTGTIPLGFADSPLDSQSSTLSSLIKLQWKPLTVNKGGKSSGKGSSRGAAQGSPSSPIPRMLPQGTQMVTQPKNPRISIGSNKQSVYPEFSGDSSPEDTAEDTVQLPKHAYVPDQNIANVQLQESHRRSHSLSEIALAIGSPSQQPKRRFQQLQRESQQYQSQPQQESTLHSEHDTEMVSPAYPAAVEDYYAPTPHPDNLTPASHPGYDTLARATPHMANINNTLNDSPPRTQSPPPTGLWRGLGHDQDRTKTNQKQSSEKRPDPFNLNPNREKWPPLRGGAAREDEDLEHRNHLSKQWKINVATPLAIALLFFCGLISAALNHIFYTQLSSTTPRSGYQQWHIRAGIAIAVFTASMWTAAVAICYRQRVWTALMQRSVKVNGIDALWGLLHDPSNFLVRETWRKSKLAIAIAIVCWLIPLIIIFVPGALTVLNYQFEDNTVCLVPTFDPATNNPSQPSLTVSQDQIDKLNQDKPAKDISLVVPSSDPIQLTTFSKRMGTVAAFSGHIVDIPIPDQCILNCSYTISFTAPGYKCEARTSDEAVTRGPWGRNFDQIFQSGNNINDTVFYSALLDNQTSSGGQNNGNSNSDDTLGMGSFWVAARYLPKNITDNHPELLQDPTKATKDMFVEEIFQCTDYVVQYSNVEFEYINGNMDVRIPPGDAGMRYLAPVNYANQFQGENDPTVLNRVVHDFTSSILLGGIEIQKNVARNVKNADVLRSTQIEGTFLMDETRFFGGVGSSNSNSAPSSSGEIRERFRMPSSNLADRVEQLHRNITLSFLSEPSLDRTYWTPTTCTTRHNGLIYYYSSLALLIPYGIACLFTSISLVMGIFSLKNNGFSSDFSFSRILCTTRGNPTLDDIFKGDCCLGNVNADRKLGRQELRFGEVLVKRPLKLGDSLKRKTLSIMNENGNGIGVADAEIGGVSNDLGMETEQRKIGMGHASFGVVGEVVGLRRDKAYR